MNVISKLRWSDWLGLGMIAVSIVLSSVVGDQFSLFPVDISLDRPHRLGTLRGRLGKPHELLDVPVWYGTL